MLPRPPGMAPTTASAAPSIIFCTSTNTAAVVAAAISSFPSCVSVMPVGEDGSGTTRASSTFPPDRLRTAMPEFPRPVSDTNTQQPSLEDCTMKGGPGREIVTDGEAAGALHPLGWVCAVMVNAVMSRIQAIPRNMRRLYSSLLVTGQVMTSVGPFTILDCHDLPG